MAGQLTHDRLNISHGPWRSLLGSEEGFVLLGRFTRDWRPSATHFPLAATGTLDDPAAAPAEVMNHKNLAFGPPLAEFGKL